MAARVKQSSVNKCVFCASPKLFEVIDFGDVALAGSFLKKSQIPKEKKYPLTVDYCQDCYAVQVRDHVEPKVLFATDFYFSSAIKTLVDHFSDYAAEITNRFLANPKKAVVVEFGSNDGVLLKPLADKGVGTVIGVDPAKNIVDSIDDDRLVLIKDFFTQKVADSIVKKYGRADIVTANHTFAHISDINGTTEAVIKLLKPNGVFIFEVHYLGKIIDEMQYDMIYHEHVYYYSLLALQNHLARHGMIIFDLKQLPIRGGSIRLYAAKSGSRYAKQISSRVKTLEMKEKKLGYDNAETYKQFASRVAAKKQKLMVLLDKLKSQQQKIVGYGASGRANTIIQYCGINKNHLDFMIDDSPIKHGLHTPGSHLKIMSNEALNKIRSDYVLLFAWPFFDEVIAKSSDYLAAGGQFIVPLPEVKIINSSGLKA